MSTWRVSVTLHVEVEASSAASAMTLAARIPYEERKVGRVEAYQRLPEIEIRRWRGRLVDLAEQLEMEDDKDTAERIRAALGFPVTQPAPTPPSEPPRE